MLKTSPGFLYERVSCPDSMSTTIMYISIRVRYSILVFEQGW